MPTLTLPKRLRPVLKKPFGTLFSTRKALENLRREKRIIAVGDIATLHLLSKGIPPWIAFVDYHYRRRPLSRTQRKRLSRWKARTWRLTNPAGTLSENAFRLTKKLLALRHQRHVVEVRGEEDLLVIPAALQAKKDTVIYYGQPGRGGVVMRATKTVKARIRRVFRGFIQGKGSR
ncbi:DUF359 domain-containing protein [Candidatus Micrarchaeota archaeon]|nr:DUF359 domain-containing protein [Candidatus Micrarchaeota archaeon]